MTIKAQKQPRDLAREREFLQRASVLSRDGEQFREHAHERLAAGEDAFGDRWTTMTLAQFSRELAEEAADLAAWAALADQQADQELPASHRAAFRMLLIRAARAGAAAHEACCAALAFLEKVNDDPGRARAIEA